MRTITAVALLALLMVSTPVGVTRARFDPERFGIGAEIAREDSLSAIRVKSCLRMGPADRAGIKPDDVLLQLDGLDISRWSFQEVVHYLTRDRPLPVQVTIQRVNTVLSFQVERERFSDIARGAGFRYEMMPDSSGYKITMLKEPDLVEVGDVVVLGALRDLSCEERAPRTVPGRRTLIYFWATWCGPCKTLIGRLNDERLPRDCQLIGINVDNDCEAFKAAVNGLHPPGEQCWAGWYGDLPQALGISRRGVPVGAVLNQDGRLLGSALGVDSILTLFREAKLPAK